MTLQSEFSKIEIDINIARSRIQELEGLKEMNISQLKRIYADKRQWEIKNKDLEKKLETKVDGSGANDIDFKQNMEVMEQE